MLFRGAEPVALGKRAVAVLRALVARPGVPVSKDARFVGPVGIEERGIIAPAPAGANIAMAADATDQPA